MSYIVINNTDSNPDSLREAFATTNTNFDTASSSIAAVSASVSLKVNSSSTTATPTAGAIPIADGSGLLDAWVTPSTVSSASVSVAGIAKLSVAPASAANPIAVGDNDTRVPVLSNSIYLNVTPPGESITGGIGLYLSNLAKYEAVTWPVIIPFPITVNRFILHRQTAGGGDAKLVAALFKMSDRTLIVSGNATDVTFGGSTGQVMSTVSVPVVVPPGTYLAAVGFSSVLGTGTNLGTYRAMRIPQYLQQTGSGCYLGTIAGAVPAGGLVFLTTLPTASTNTDTAIPYMAIS